MPTDMEMERTDLGWSWGAAVAATAVVLGLIAAPPFVPAEIRQVIMVGFSGVCHQLPARSPHLLDVQLAVCDRCLGIYSAMPVAALLFPLAAAWRERLRRRAGLVILIAVLAPAVDWMGDVAGLWVNSPASRYVTGAAFGLAAGYYLTSGLVNLSSNGAEDDPARKTKGTLVEIGEADVGTPELR